MPSVSTILLAMLLHHQRQVPRISLRNCLKIAGRRRRDRRVTRRALQSPAISPFMVLLQSMCDQSLITVTGFDHYTSVALLQQFSTQYSRFSPYSEDRRIRIIASTNRVWRRPRSMSATGCLGLILAWHITRESVFTLCMLFGVTLSVCPIFICFGRRLLLRILSRDSRVHVRMPDQHDIDQYKTAFTTKYMSLQDVQAVADGPKLYLEQSGDFVTQNMFYNGRMHDHYVGNVFVFAPSGTIISCAINAPGCIHDFKIAEWGGVYKKLEDCYRTFGGRCVVDSTFSKGDYAFLIKSAPDETRADDAAEVVLLRQATSAGQASEWGMRTFQESFPRMKDRFVYEEYGEQKLMLLSTVLLVNLRARMVGLNQILFSYVPHLSAEAIFFLHESLHV